MTPSNELVQQMRAAADMPPAELRSFEIALWKGQAGDAGDGAFRVTDLCGQDSDGVARRLRAVMREAAAALEAANARADAAEAEAVRLREALKPFAGPFPDFTEAWHDDAQLWAQNGDAIIVKMTLGDLRRARAALADEARS